MNEKPVTLFDLGERRILREVIPRFTEGAGDDCAELEPTSRRVVVTTDPVPRPAAHVIGGDDDPRWLGWLLVTINASDIAASGAKPEGFVAALDLPRDYPLRLFERLLGGIQASCRANALRYIGGNIRETTGAVAGVGTAFGSSVKPVLSRSGALPGDFVLVVGESGRFWADAFRHRSGLHLDKASSPLFSPVSQATTIHRLHEADLLACGMDTSDGLAPTLEELAIVNSVAIEVDLGALRGASQYDDIAIRAERLWFGWGDWTVVSTVREAKLEALSTAMASICRPWAVIGRVVAGQAKVDLVDHDRRLRAHRLESERFASDSWFTEGIDEYIRRLEAFPLP
jgi:thiamine-monophosphate kinase